MSDPITRRQSNSSLNDRLEALEAEYEFITSAALTNGVTYTMPHGLGRLPKFAVASLVVDTATAGYNIGDEILRWMDGVTSVVDTQISVYYDTVNIYVRSTNTGVAIHNKSTGAITNAAVTNFKVKVQVK